MSFIFFFFILFDIVTSISFTEITQNNVNISYREFSINLYIIESFSYISYFDCINNQYELCIWDSSLIYDVQFYNNKIVSYSINKTLSVNSDSLSKAYLKFILKNYPTHAVFISVASFLLCIWFLVFRYEKILFPIGAIILSVNGMIFHIYPRGWHFFLFDPFCRLFLLSITAKDFFYKNEKEIHFFLNVLSHYLNEIQHCSDLKFISLYIAFELFISIVGQLNFVVKKKMLYSNFIWDESLNRVYSIRRKYIYSIIYHSTLSLFSLLIFIWIVKDSFSSNFSDIRRSIFCLYFYLIYMIIIAVFYFPMFKLEITINDIIIGLKILTLLKMKREYIVGKVNQTKFGLTEKEGNELEITCKKNKQNIVVVYNPMNKISTGTIKL